MSSAGTSSFENAPTKVSNTLSVSAFVVATFLLLIGFKLEEFSAEVVSLIGGGIVIVVLAFGYQWRRGSFRRIYITGDRLIIEKRFAKNHEYSLSRDLTEVHTFNDEAAGIDVLVFKNGKFSFRLVIDWFDYPSELREILYLSLPSLKDSNPRIAEGGQGCQSNDS